MKTPYAMPQRPAIGSLFRVKPNTDLSFVKIVDSGFHQVTATLNGVTVRLVITGGLFNGGSNRALVGDDEPRDLGLLLMLGAPVAGALFQNFIVALWGEQLLMIYADRMEAAF